MTRVKGNSANIAIDGVKSDGATNVGSTHTQCSDTPFPWWRVYFGLGQIKTVKVYNRNDCVSFSSVILIVHSFVSSLILHVPSHLTFPEMHPNQCELVNLP